MTDVVRDPRALREYIEMAHRNRFSLGFVATMGALHEGHLSLVRRSVRENDRTIVSVYVNPLQFGVALDLERYQRVLEDDVALCSAARTDVVFAPSVRDMQPPGRATLVTLSGITDDFEGVHRPGHFDGVATIVATLFNLVRPHRAYFGQKDFQQAVVVRRMARDLQMPVDVVVCPIVRDADGLALSSRNAFLSDADRAEALRLPRALVAAERALLEDDASPAAVRALLADAMSSERDDVEMEYGDLVHPETLAPIHRLDGHGVLLGLLRVGSVRLLDNRVVASPGTPAWGD